MMTEPDSIVVQNDDHIIDDNHVIDDNNHDHDKYVVIVEDELSLSSAEELQLESDGTLLLSTLQVHYPTVTSLKYRNPETGTFRTLKVIGDRIHPPADSQRWHDRVFVIVKPKGIINTKVLENQPLKRAHHDDSQGEENEDEAGVKLEEKDEDDDNHQNEPIVKQMKMDYLKKEESQIGNDSGNGQDMMEFNNKGNLPPKVDLIILNLSYETENEEIEDYFKSYGEIDMVEVKKDAKNRSRGFAFIRFKSRLIQRKVLLNGPYELAGRTVSVRRADIKKRDPDSSRLFVTKLPEDVQNSDLQNYFEKYGKVVDVYIPRKSFRGFGFLTFETPDSINEVLDDGEEHFLENGMRIIISRAAPRISNNGMSSRSSGSGSMSRGGSGGGGGGYGGGGPYGGGNISTSGSSLLDAPVSSYGGGGSSGGGGGYGPDQEQLIYQAVKQVLQQQQHHQGSNFGMRQNAPPPYSSGMQQQYPPQPDGQGRRRSYR